MKEKIAIVGLTLCALLFGIEWHSLEPFAASENASISISNPPAANVDSQWITSISATTGTLTFSGLGTEIQLGGATQVAVEYEIATGTTAGVIVLEHSAVTGYTGTWANLDTQTVGSSFATAPSKTVFTYPGPLGFIHARITTSFSGGATPGVIVRIKRMFGQ